jgi:hypothetical protein
LAAAHLRAIIAVQLAAAVDAPKPRAAERPIRLLDMNPLEEALVVRRGWWLYDGMVRLEVRVVRQSVFYGTGDYEDPPEISEDREMECFSVWSETTTRELPRFAGMGQFETIESAVRHAESVIRGGVVWHDAS